MDIRTDDDILQVLNKNKIREYGLAIAYVAFVILVGVVGNIASVVFYGFKSHRTTTNRLIMYLASTDLIACLVFSDELLELCFSINFKDRIGCKFMYFFNHWLVIISGSMLVVICVDRHRKICRPLQWQFTFTKMKLCVGGVVIFAFLTSVRDFVILDIVNTNITDPDTGRQIEAHYCTHTKEPELQTLVTISHLVDLLTFFVVIVSLSVVYTIIACTLWKYQKIRRKNKLAELHSDHTEEHDESTHTTLEVHSVSAEKTSDPVKKVNELFNAATLDVAQNETTSAGTLDAAQNEKTSADTLNAAQNETTITETLNAAQNETTITETLNAAQNETTITETLDAAQNETSPVGTLEAALTNQHASTIDADQGTKSPSADKDSNQCETISDHRILTPEKEKSKLKPATDRKCYEVRNRKHAKKPSSSHKHIERNVTIMMITITAASILSFVPYFIVNLTLKRTSKTPEQEFDVGIQIALRSFILNNAINPYIAGIFNPEFRRFVKTSFRKMFCCRTTGYFRR